MTEYEIIDAICDSVNPILLLLAVGFIVRDFIQRVFSRAVHATVLFIIGVIWVYGMLFVDNTYHLWPMINSDYSTHTAVIVALCITLHTSSGWVITWLTILGLYSVAMLYQEYHTVLDIVSTAVFIGVPLLFVKHLITNKHESVSAAA